MSDGEHHHVGAAFDAQWWDDHYRADGEISAGSATPYVTSLVADEPPGVVLDAGCGAAPTRSGSPGRAGRLLRSMSRPP